MQLILLTNSLRAFIRSCDVIYWDEPVNNTVEGIVGFVLVLSLPLTLVNMSWLPVNFASSFVTLSVPARTSAVEP
jgi:hypothetical protein